MSNRKLLLADDSVTIQKVVNLTFADEGIDVTAVGDGDAAMDRFSEILPDIVLADVNMPGLTGYQICEVIRLRDEWKHIPVILLVGSFEPFDEAEARRVGANSWLTKPFQSIRQLVSMVTGLLDAPTADIVAETESTASSSDDEFVIAETAQDSPTAETDDIEDLYKESFAETVELPNSFRPETVLGDAGMDDEMIETSFAATRPESEVKQFEFVNPTDIANFDETIPVINFKPAEVDELPVTSFDYQPSVPEQTAANETYTAPHDTYSESQQEAHKPEIVVETPPQTIEHKPEDEETNVLELPLSGTSSPPAFHSDEGFESFNDSGHSEEISPEFVDAVARKVIEKISENVIRQIAWQVVPQVAESVLREKVEEESNH